MAYKNPQDKTDYQREYMRKRRQLKKAVSKQKKNLDEILKDVEQKCKMGDFRRADGSGTNEEFLSDLKVYLTYRAIDELTKDPVILELMMEMQKEYPDITAEMMLKIVYRVFGREEGKTEERKIKLIDVADWLFKHIDTQFIQIAGGTQSRSVF